MGQAEVRRAAHQRWIKSLSEADRIIARVASSLHSKFPRWGACYQTAMFLGFHLYFKYDIQAEVVIGYVNDGTDDLYASHAWIETDERITDVAISRPQHPHLQKSGPLLIIGTTINSGWNGYTYHREVPAAGVEEIEKMRADPSFRSQYIEREKLIRTMTVMARYPTTQLKFLNNDPEGMSYDQMARLVEG